MERHQAADSDSYRAKKFANTPGLRLTSRFSSTYFLSLSSLGFPFDNTGVKIEPDAGLSPRARRHAMLKSNPTEVISGEDYSKGQTENRGGRRDRGKGFHREAAQPSRKASSSGAAKPRGGRRERGQSKRGRSATAPRADDEELKEIPSESDSSSDNGPVDPQARTFLLACESCNISLNDFRSQRNGFETRFSSAVCQLLIMCACVKVEPYFALCAADLALLKPSYASPSLLRQSNNPRCRTNVSFSSPTQGAAAGALLC